MNNHGIVVTLNLESHSTFQHVGHIHCQPHTPRKDQLKAPSTIKPRSDDTIHLKDPLGLVSPRHARTLPFPLPLLPVSKGVSDLSRLINITDTDDLPIFVPQPLPRNSDISGQGRARARVSPHPHKRKRKPSLEAVRQAITDHELKKPCRHLSTGASDHVSSSAT